jgi:hypothetical protein
MWLTAGCWWLTPIILATQEAEIVIQSQPRQIVQETLLKNPVTKKELAEWLKQ